MKIVTALLLCLMFAFYSSCMGQPKTDLPESAHEKYVIDRRESVITWKGSMVFASKGGHAGYLYISNGDLLFEKNQLVGGTVEVDMSTMADEFHGSENGLIDHLKSPDFFDVKKFPSSTFVITKVVSAAGENLSVNGNLTIKGITHEVTFLVKVEMKDGIVNARGNLTIDRSKWDVRYKSKKFFANLADETISDDIELKMKMVARK